MATGIFRAVRVMDGRNQERFRDDKQPAGARIAASTVLGQPSRLVEAGPVEPGREAYRLQLMGEGSLSLAADAQAARPRQLPVGSC